LSVMFPPTRGMPKLVGGGRARCRETGRREFLKRRRRAGHAEAYTWCSAPTLAKGDSVNHIPGTKVSERIAVLIERHDGGNQEVAALRLGIEPDHLSDMLSGDWARFTLDALAKLVRGYSVPLETLLWTDPEVAPGSERGRECQ
jgi:hypothetical protein